MEKAVITLNDTKVDLYVPFAKVDAERRIVSGFATLDNVDLHGDIVDPDASAKAFEVFRGNIREMHQPKAVGKLLSFKTTRFIDPETGQLYRGVFVDVFVSKAAEDTWTKVLEGVLTGFSIGGKVNKFAEAKPAEGARRRITDYSLVELSLVDSPANPLASVTAIRKSEDGYEGLVPDTQITNVFKCDCGVVETSEDETLTCSACDSDMTYKGWVEAPGIEADIKRVLGLDEGTTNDVEKFGSVLNRLEEIVKQLEGGASMAQETDKTEVEGTEETVEKAAEVSEVEETVEKTDETPDIDAIVKAAVEAALAERDAAEAEKSVEKSEEAEEVEKADETDEEAEEAVEDEVLKSIDEKLGNLAETLGKQSKTIDSLASRLEAVESTTAIRKSREVADDEDDEDEAGSVWKGAFGGDYLKASNL